MGNFFTFNDNAGSTQSTQSIKIFHIGDKVIYTEHGMKLYGIITHRVNTTQYGFLGEGDLYGRLVYSKYLFHDLPPQY